MGKIKLGAILIVCFALAAFVTGRVSAEEICLSLTGGVYHMISSPYMPENRDPQESLVDDLGPYDITKWRFFRYGYYPDPDNPGEYLNRYFELKMDWSIEQDFDYGRGYWIISRDSKEICIDGTPVAQNWIMLEHEGDGWNQIGNIFDYDFPIANLEVARESDPLNTLQLIDPIENNLTYVTLQDFENGDYIDVPVNGSLGVGKGYWLRVKEGVGEDVFLYFVVGAPNSLSEEIYLSEEFLEKVAQQENPPDPPPAFKGPSSVSLSSSGGCFIATVTYGDYDHPNVQILRGFRDQYLSTNSLGKMFVSLYYRHSPTLAHFVAKRSSMKALVRFSLMPLIGMSTIVSKMNVYAYFAIMASPLLGGFFFLRRRQRVLGRWKVKHSSKSKEGKRKR